MNRTERVYHLNMIAEAFEKEHLETEAEAIREAIYDTGIVEELKKERDAALEELRHFTGIQCPEGGQQCRG